MGGLHAKGTTLKTYNRFCTRQCFGEHLIFPKARIYLGQEIHYEAARCFAPQAPTIGGVLLKSPIGCYRAKLVLRFGCRLRRPFDGLEQEWAGCPIAARRHGRPFQVGRQL